MVLSESSGKLEQVPTIRRRSQLPRH